MLVICVSYAVHFCSIKSYCLNVAGGTGPKCPVRATLASEIWASYRLVLFPFFVGERQAEKPLLGN